MIHYLIVDPSRMIIMSFFNRISLSSLYVTIFATSLFSMDGDIEEAKQSHLVEMTSVNTKHQGNLTCDSIQQAASPLPGNAAPSHVNRILEYGKDVIEEKSNHGDSAKRTDEEKSNDSIDSILLGNQDSRYSNSILECYAKKASTCWSFLYTWLGDFDSIFQASETALMTCTQFASSKHFSIYVIEMTMIADTFRQLYSLSQRIAPIRGKQARAYERQNRLNALEKKNPERLLLINGKDASENVDFYASKSAACCYNFCATYRNIAWEQIGVLAILCRISANSVVAFSLATDENKCKSLLFVAMLLRIGGTACYLYAKNLSKNTKEMEQMAMDSANFIEHKERLKKESAAATNDGVADMA